MSFMLQHLNNGWQVDQAILSEEDRVVCIRFGHDWDPTCMQMDESLYSIAEKVLIISLFPRTRFNLSLYFVRDVTTYVYTYSIYKVEKNPKKIKRFY